MSNRELFNQVRNECRNLLRIIESAKELILVLQDNRIVFINKHVERISGYSSNELINQEFTKFVHPDSRAKVLEHFKKEQENYEFRIIKKNGDTLWISVSVSEIKWEGKKGFLLVARDITERKKTEKELKKSKEKYCSIFNSVNDAVFIHDIETGRVIDVNQQTIEMFKLDDKSDIIGSTVSEISSDEESYSSEQALKLIKKAAKDEPQLFEWHSKKKNGELFWTEVNLKKARIGAEDKLLAIVRDISDRKKIEKDLRKMINYYQAIFENTGTAVVIIEPDTTLSLVNSEFEQLSGYSKREIEGKMSWTEFVTEEYLPKMKEYHEFRRKNSEVPKKYEFDFIDKSGTIKRVLITIGMIPNSKKSIASLLDITHRKELEKIKLRKNLKEELRHLRTKFLRNVSHQLRQPLVPIMGYVSLLLEQDLTSQQRDYLKKVLDNCTELNSLVNKIIKVLSFESKEIKLSFKKQLLKPLIKEVIKEYEPKALEKGLKLESDLRINPELRVDADKLIIAVSNLVDNALKFTNKGLVKVMLRKSGDNVLIIIKDTGEGIDKKVMGFKRQGGLGLGLLLTKHIINAHKGELKINLIPGKGTEAKIVLPKSF